MDETQPESASIAAELKIDATLIAKLNLADFQNAVPLIRDLALINETDQTHEQVELILTSEPPFLKSRRWRIDALAAHSRYPIRDLDLNLDGGLLARLTELFRSARTNLQEGGANTLYLALGFLSWTREDRDGQRYRAPLILVPVSLQRQSARSGFTLSLHDDEPRFNPTLIEMLRQDFELNLGSLEGELPRDENGLDVAAVWKAVGHAIKDIKGWEVTEDVILSMFSFAKYLMWKDLAERSEQLRENPVVRHLLDTPRDPYPPGAPSPQVRELDRHFDPKQVFYPLPADSSQLSAVLSNAG